MRVAAVLCAAVGIVVYIDTLNCGFCFDDLSAITENQDLRLVKEENNPSF